MEGRCIWSIGSFHRLVSLAQFPIPVPPSRPLVSVTSLENKTQRQLTTVKLTTASSVLHEVALIDSGADSNLMDSSLGQSLGATVEPLSTLLHAVALDGMLIATVTHQTSPIQMRFPDGHVETLCFHLYHSEMHPLILGYP